MTESVLYEERDGVAIITINRPERLNTLTVDVIRGVADGVEQAAHTSDVAAIILRGEGGNISAGYDLREFLDDSGPEQGEIWDPVEDYQSMAANVRQFMKIWECPKPVIGEISGWALGGATDLILCADLLFMATNAQIGYAPQPNIWNSDHDDVGASNWPGTRETIFTHGPADRCRNCLPYRLSFICLRPR